VLEQLVGRPLGTVCFGPAELDQARRLLAAHGEERPLIVGAELAGQLAGDYITRCLKTQRANQRERERAVDAHEPADAQDGVADGEAERAAADARRAQRDAEREARARAVAFNAGLGRGVYTSLSRVKVDERALRILSSVNATGELGELGELVMRGAGCGLPGWVTESTQRTATSPSTSTSAHRPSGAPREYLAGARTSGEIVGRQIALLAMAAYADQDAVAASNRSWHEVRSSGRWAGPRTGCSTSSSPRSSPSPPPGCSRRGSSSANATVSSAPPSAKPGRTLSLGWTGSSSGSPSSTPTGWRAWRRTPSWRGRAGIRARASCAGCSALGATRSQTTSRTVTDRNRSRSRARGVPYQGALPGAPPLSSQVAGCGPLGARP
jgi:hypothetical protein